MSLMTKDQLDVREVTFRRKFNLGNYETMDIEFVATIHEDQDFQEVAKLLDRETIKFKKSRES